MSDDITYLDLLILRKVDAESTVEKFGSQINTSFFEAANLLGTMKIKGLIDIQSSIGGQSPLVITGDGRDLLAEATRKSTEPSDTLDQAILHALAGGVGDLYSLQSAINIRSRDLAFHLHKLKNLDLMDYEVRSGKVRLFLTEKGFNQTGRVRSVGSPGSEVAGAKPSLVSGAPGSSSLGSSGSASRVNVPASSSTPGQQHLSDSSGRPASAGQSNTASSKPFLSPSIDAEINDILNFGGWGKSKATPASSPIQMGGSSATVSKPGASIVNPGASGAMSPKPASAAPFIRPAASSLPTGNLATPISASDAPVKLDRTSMLFSKLEYYARQYVFYILLLILLAGLLVYALLFAITARAGA
jgi:hypothetical protein